ncbi:MAG: glycosyltransferase, partial [Anaerolineae bacterium]|nr:glycosyltransferase [Anaerolineae bacterium]
MSSIMIAFIAVMLGLIEPLISQQQPWARLADASARQQTQAAAATTAVVLAMDASSYMDGYSMRKAQEAARQFIDKADAATAIAIVTFADSAKLTQDFTQDKTILLTAINGLKPRGVRALYDGGALAINTAANASASRRVVVLMSNGPEYRYQSKATRKDVLELAKTRGVPVYTVAVGTLVDRPLFKELAQVSSAESYTLDRAEGLVGVYTTLSARLLGSPATPRTPIPAAAANSVTTTTPITPVPTTGKDTLIKSASLKTPQAPIAPAPVSNSKPKQTVTSAVVLAIDTSSNMTGAPLRKAKEAARLFVDKADASTPIAVVTFGDKANMVQDFTSDKSVLASVIDSLKTSGNRALYDGSLAAVNLAANTAAQRRIVILVSNGAEYRYQSKSARKEAIALAKTRSVAVYTVGLGTAIDRAYLRELAAAANGQPFTVVKADELVTVYTALGAQLVGSPLLASNSAADPVSTPAASTASTTTTTTTSASAADPVTAGKDAPVSNGGIVLAESPKPGVNVKPVITAPEAPKPISPIASNPAAVTDQKPGTAVNPIAPAAGDLKPINAGANQPAASSDPKVANLAAAQPATPADPADTLSSSIMPITVTVPESNAVARATLDINGQVLATFTTAPYEYDLDTRALSAGHYMLTFTVINDKQVTSQGSLDFDVIVKVPDNAAAEEAPESDILNGRPRRTTATILDSAPRVLLVNGKALPFDLSFAPETGLVVVEPKPATAETPNETLGAILTKPASLIPQPIKDALLAQHPTFWSVVMLIMTIILLPQGIFTLYWMMYTWNKPELAEKYRSPKEYLPAQHSFTAILPARHEAGVIKDTIKAVDRIDYPDHLKEILVMIRDEDDDETINAAKEAIAEIGKDTIKLITFTTGPKNKPNGLNRGLKAASNEIVCVFDAEDEPHPELYNVVNTVMIRDNADVVQSGVQLMNFKSTWFSALNCLEYFFWFKSGLHCFTHALKVTPLGGNTVFFKKHWLQRINGWDEHCLTEDADVGIRLTQLGAKIQIVYDEKHATQEETPHNVESFIKQRTRWSQGFYEIFFKGDWLKLPMLK